MILSTPAHQSEIVPHMSHYSYQSSGVSFWWYWTKVIIGNSHHDSATGRICSASPHCSICGESLIWSVLVPDMLKVAVVVRVLHALLGHPNGCRKRGVDAWIGCKFWWERVPTSGTGLFTLGHPLFQTCKTEVVLAWSLQATEHIVGLTLPIHVAACLESCTYSDRSHTELHAHSALQAVIKHGRLCLRGSCCLVVLWEHTVCSETQSSDSAAGYVTQ